MGLLLNLETATTNCSVSIAKNGELLAMREDNSPNYSHSEQLHLFIEETAKEAGISLNDLDAVAVSKGPGSYTGLRIGVSAAKGLCFSLNVPLISVATLESMAHQVKDAGAEFIVPLLDARRMEVYSAIFNSELRQVRETEAEIVDEKSFGTYWQKGRTLLVGSGAEKCKEILKDSNVGFNTALVPSAREMAKLSYERFKCKDFEDVAYFEPYYLKNFILQQKKK